MIRNVSYNNRKIKAQINKKIGLDLGMWQRIKKGWWGIANIQLLSADGELKTLLYTDSLQPKFNIELRPLGLMIYFRRYLETYALVMHKAEIKLEKNQLRVAGENFTGVFSVGQVKDATRLREWLNE